MCIPMVVELTPIISAANRFSQANSAEIAVAECMDGSVALEPSPPNLKVDCDLSDGRDLRTDPVGRLATDTLDLDLLRYV